MVMFYREYKTGVFIGTDCRIEYSERYLKYAPELHYDSVELSRYYHTLAIL